MLRKDRLTVEALEQRYLLTTVVGDGVPDEPLDCNAAHAMVGDANCDGIFNSSDLILIFQSNEYEDGRPDNSGWADGDFDGNGDFEAKDIILALQNSEYERDSGGVLPHSSQAGDVNQDGLFDSSDVLQIMKRGQYEDLIEENSGWRDGDFNGDGDVTSEDIVLAWQTGNYELDPLR